MARGAIAGFLSLPAAAERALAAGSTSSSSPATPPSRPSLAHLERAVAAGGISRARVREAFLRVQAFKGVGRWAGC